MSRYTDSSLTPARASETQALLTTGAKRPLRSRSQRSVNILASVLIMALPFAVYVAFMLVPLARVINLSFFHWDGLADAVPAGFSNYTDVFSNERLRASFVHALILIVFYAAIPLGIGLVLASLLGRSRARGIGFVRTVVFLPQVIAMVVLAIAWRQIYAPDGMINTALRALGLGGLARAWLGEYSTALIAVGFIGTWVCTGLVTVLLMSGVTRVPQEYYEAARLDGAGWFRQFFSITIPSLRPEILVSLTLTIIAALKTFDVVYMTTAGGPGTSTTVPSYEVYYQAFKVGAVGTTAALAVVLTIVIFLINLAVNLVGEREK